MNNKIVLITGSSSGIGKASALRFARLGCRLTIHGTDATRLEDVARMCHELSPNAHKPLQVLGDVRDAKVLKRLIEETVDSLGGLDVLVNNAGLFKPCAVDAPGSLEVFNDLMKINLDSAVQLTILAAPHLKKARGCIVNISSNLHAKCIGGGFAYCTAKAALTMFTKSAAVDLAPLVRVNSISPGPVATLMSARCGVDSETYRANVGKACLVERVGEADEIARLVIFLASPESAFITGSDYMIDGGSTVKPEGNGPGKD